MNSGRVAIRYAKGLLKFANECNLADEFYSNSLTLIQILRESESLPHLINNPLISSEKKLEILKRSIAQSINANFFDYINIIIRKGRFEYFLNSLLLFRDLYRAEKGILEVQVESASQLTDMEISAINDLIKNHFDRKTELFVTVKPQLIAGFILIVEGKIMDYSVTGQLLQFRKNFGLTQSS